MTKEDTLDLVLKAFGIYLLILALMAIPKFISGIGGIWWLWQAGAFDWDIVAQSEMNSGIFSDAFASKTAKLAQSQYLTEAISGITRLLVYTFAARHLLRGGSLVKRLMRKKEELQNK